MTNFAKLPTWANKQHVYAVVETPRGSRAKLEFDSKLGAFTLAKPLLAVLIYPYDWGFIPSTRAEDGDPLDVLIIHDAATYPGLVLKCKPIGVLEVVQSAKGKKERNDRVFVVRDRSPFEGDLQGHRGRSRRLEEFFEATDALESKKLKFQGWRGSASRRRVGRLQAQSQISAYAQGGQRICRSELWSFGRLAGSSCGDRRCAAPPCGPQQTRHSADQLFVPQRAH